MSIKATFKRLLQAKQTLERGYLPTQQTLSTEWDNLIKF